MSQFQPSCQLLWIQENYPKGYLGLECMVLFSLQFLSPYTSPFRTEDIEVCLCRVERRLHLLDSHSKTPDINHCSEGAERRNFAALLQELFPPYSSLASLSTVIFFSLLVQSPLTALDPLMYWTSKNHRQFYFPKFSSSCFHLLVWTLIKACVSVRKTHW